MSSNANVRVLTKVTDGVYFIPKSQLVEGNMDELVKNEIKCYLAACKEADIPQSVKDLLNNMEIKSMALSPTKVSALENAPIFETESDMAILKRAINSGNVVIGYDDKDRRPILALLGVSMMKTKCSFLEALARCICACPLKDMEMDFKFCHTELISVFNFKQEGEDEDNYRCLLDVDGGLGFNFIAHLIVTDNIKKTHGNYANLLKELKTICGLEDI